MKIKTLTKSYDEVMAIKPPKHFKPQKTNLFWQTLIKIISAPALISSHFTYKKVGMEKLGKNEPGSSPPRAACLGEAMSETASSPQAAACDIPPICGIRFPEVDRVMF